MKNLLLGAASYVVSLWNGDLVELLDESKFKSQKNLITLESLKASTIYSVSIQSVGSNGLYSESSEIVDFITSKQHQSVFDFLFLRFLTFIKLL